MMRWVCPMRWPGLYRPRLGLLIGRMDPMQRTGGSRRLSAFLTLSHQFLESSQSSLLIDRGHFRGWWSRDKLKSEVNWSRGQGEQPISRGLRCRHSHRHHLSKAILIAYSGSLLAKSLFPLLCSFVNCKVSDAPRQSGD